MLKQSVDERCLQRQESLLPLLMLRVRDLNSFGSIFANNKGSLLASRARNTPSFCSSADKVFSVCSALSAEVGPRLLFFGRSASELVGQSGHLTILNGCSAGEPVHDYCHLLVRKGISSYAGAERTCYLAIGCRASAWFVRATLDPDAADVSRPHNLLWSPLVHRRWLGVFQNNI